MAEQYIGSVISLISKSDIRYQGILHSINPAEATVSLERVRSLGTEGRKGDPAAEIPGNDNVYDFIVFRASDVKDLQIESPSTEPPAPAQPPSDPAIVGTNAPTSQPPQSSPEQKSSQPPQQQQLPQHPPSNYGPGAPFGGYPGYPPPPQGYYAPGPYGFPPPGAPGFGAPSPFGPPGQGGYGHPGMYGPPGGFMGGPPPFSPPQHPGQPLQSPSVQSQSAPSPNVQKQGAPAQDVKSPAAPAAPAAQAKPSAPAPATNGDAKPASMPAAAAPAAGAKPASTQPQAPTPAVTSSPQSAAPAAASQPPKPRSYANPNGVAPPASAPAPATRQGSDVEQLAKDMSRANITRAPTGPGNAPRKDGVGPSVFGLAGGRTQGGAAPGGGGRPPRTLQPYGQPTAPLPAADFDYQSSTASFKKDEEVVIPPAPAEAYYDRKASFFDSISSDIKTRNEEGGQTQRFDRGAERSKNMDTFGESGGFSGYGRGRGRGGRGRGYGRGRGGAGGVGVGGPRQF